MIKPLIVAIDGHSSCGKSSFAKAIARKLGYIYIDSGAMYRAVTLFCLENNLMDGKSLDYLSLLDKLPGLEIKITFNKDKQQYETCLNGRNVEEAIRMPDVSEAVSLIAKIREVRERLVTMQRSIGANKAIVMDGRDIGTVVFPTADIKIFMTASLEVRAARRYKELSENGVSISFEEVLENIKTREMRWFEKLYEETLLK
jgi:cytidylate kinase